MWKWKSLSHVWLFATPWTIQTMEFSRPEYWSILFPSPGISPTQGSNPGLLHCTWILHQLSHQGSPRILEWGAYPFSRGSSQPGIEPGSPAWQADSLPAELPRKPNICKEYLKIQIIISDVDTPWIIWEDSERLNVCYRVKEQIIAGKSFSFKVLH